MSKTETPTLNNKGNPTNAVVKNDFTPAYGFTALCVIEQKDNFFSNATLSRYRTKLSNNNYWTRHYSIHKQRSNSVLPVVSVYAISTLFSIVLEFNLVVK
jgi:hypothetical protein